MAETNQATVKTILLSSPTGQFDIILEDLRSLLPKSSISSLLEPNFVSATRSEWESATGRSVLASVANDGAENNGADGSLIASSLSKAMDDYLAFKYSSPGVRAAHQVTTAAATIEGAPTFAIVTYAERIDLHNQHAGSWKGSFTVCPKTGSLCGSISVTAHTFENGGNVQLHSTVTLEETNIGACEYPDVSDECSSWATAVTSQIEAWEDKKVMENLAGMYESMGNTYLKSLRRVMPITRTKMEWNVMAHRVRQTLGEGHDKEKFKH